jgi:hypothetical protein
MVSLCIILLYAIASYYCKPFEDPKFNAINLKSTIAGKNKIKITLK